jgi:hypothetical protein
VADRKLDARRELYAFLNGKRPAAKKKAAKKPAKTSSKPAPKKSENHVTEEIIIKGLRRKLEKGNASAADIKRLEQLSGASEGEYGRRWTESKVIAEFLNLTDTEVRKHREFTRPDGTFDSWRVINRLAYNRGSSVEADSKEELERKYKLEQVRSARLKNAILQREYIPADETDRNMREVANIFITALKEIINSAPAVVCEKLNVSFDSEETIRESLDSFARARLKQLQDRIKKLEEKIEAATAAKMDTAADED